MESSRESLWLKTSQATPFAPFSGDREVDVCIVGGGIAGLTAALLLQRAGKRVALLEQGRLGNGGTGFTTAHLTEALDTRYLELAKSSGGEGARLAAESQRAAIDQIERLVREESIDCAFTPLDGYLYSETSGEQLEREHRAALGAGCDVSLLPKAPLPFPTVAALQFRRQAQFHPLRYLMSLADKLAAAGTLLHEQSGALTIQDGEPCIVETERGRVRAAQVLVCTHSPVNDRLVLQTKLAQYRSYVVTARVAPRIDGLFWDDQDPYHYLRMHGGLLLAGGADHKVGQESETAAHHDDLRAYVRAKFGESVEFEGEWSAQVVEPVDGLPYIGKNPGDQNVFVATGFSGNGMTHGTAAAMLLSDLVRGIPNPWAALYDPARIKPGAARTWLQENVDFPLHLIGDRLKPAQAKSLEEVPRGAGRLVAVGGERLAVYRDERGALTVLASACTHMGCTVTWNSAAKSWDCPCHGGRFDTDGKVLDGPALHPLPRKR